MKVRIKDWDDAVKAALADDEDMCVVDKLQDEKLNSDDILRYGKIIEDEMLYDNREFGIAYTIRIRLISYNGFVWYHKMSDGTVMECRKVGKADA